MEEKRSLEEGGRNGGLGAAPGWEEKGEGGEEGSGGVRRLIGEEGKQSYTDLQPK